MIGLMKTIILVLSTLASAQTFAATTAASYQACLTSIHEDGNVLVTELDEVSKIVYQKTSLYDRTLFLVDDKLLYSCGELSVQSNTSTADVLNYDLNLIVNQKSYSLMVEIPTVLTFGIEDFIMRESSRTEEKTVLRCTETSSELFNAAFVETAGSRLKSFPLQFRESAANKKNQEKAKIWGAGWKAKPLIDSERNSYLKVLKNCESVSALTQLRNDIKSELLSIK